MRVKRGTRTFGPVNINSTTVLSFQVKFVFEKGARYAKSVDSSF